MQISAFVDGELPDNEADLLLRRMGQDAELRQKVAEYLAIGRALRGEPSVPGVDRIHERVSAEIDDKPFEHQVEATRPPPAKAIRPLAGVAIAATVALLAIFGLQQSTSVDSDDLVPPESTIAEEDSVYTVPQQIDDQLRQYYLSHDATAPEFGTHGLNISRVTLRINDLDLADAEQLENDAVDEGPEPIDQAPTKP